MTKSDRLSLFHHGVEPFARWNFSHGEYLERLNENRHIEPMTETHKPLSIQEAVSPAFREASAEVETWQAEKIKAGLRDADQGRFASKEAVKAVIQKYIPNG